MNKIPKFNKMSDFLNNPKIKRPDDFEFQGQKVSEIIKTEAQKTLITLAKKLVLERMKELNISNNEIANDRILYHIPVGANRYDPPIDFVLLKEYSEANIGTTIHEILHANSAEWRYKDKKEIEENNKKEKHDIKSGFHSNYYKKGFDQTITSVNFSNINEAITEKISCELVNNNLEEIQKLSTLFIGRCEEQLKKYNIKFDKAQIISQQKIQKIQDKVKLDIEKAVAENKEELEKIEMDFRIGKISEEELKQAKEIWKDFLKDRIKNIKSYSKSYEKLEKWNSNDQARKVILDEIKEDYAFKEKQTSYKKLVEILNLMIEGLSYSTSKTKKESEKQKKLIWAELQKAYFKGRVMFLRKFDKVYDDKIMRTFDKLSRYENKDTEVLISYLKEKNEKIKSDNFLSI